MLLVWLQTTSHTVLCWLQTAAFMFHWPSLLIAATFKQHSRWNLVYKTAICPPTVCSLERPVMQPRGAGSCRRCNECLTKGGIKERGKRKGNENSKTWNAMHITEMITGWYESAVWFFSLLPFSSGASFALASPSRERLFSLLLPPTRRQWVIPPLFLPNPTFRFPYPFLYSSSSTLWQGEYQIWVL